MRTILWQSTLTHAACVRGNAFDTLYLWQPQDFHLCEQRNALVFSGTPNLAWKAKVRRSAAHGRGWRSELCSG